MSHDSHPSCPWATDWLIAEVEAFHDGWSEVIGLDAILVSLDAILVSRGHAPNLSKGKKWDERNSSKSRNGLGESYDPVS
jgi:hypothetical protein